MHSAYRVVARKVLPGQKNLAINREFFFSTMENISTACQDLVSKAHENPKQFFVALVATAGGIWLTKKLFQASSRFFLFETMLLMLLVKVFCATTPLQ